MRVPKQPTGLRNKIPDPDLKSNNAAYYSRLTPGVLAAKKTEAPANLDLVRLVNTKANELFKERLQGSVFTRIPIYTSFERKGPFEIIRPEPAEAPKPKWVDINESHVLDGGGAPRPEQLENQRENVRQVFNCGQRYRITEKVREWIYALIQLYIYIVYWFSSWLGANVRRPGKWRQLAFRYPPVDGGWDLFNIRAEYRSLTRSNVIYTKKKIWFNPETGRYETAIFTNLDDESQYQDRYPGETDGLDPVEFAKYHYLSPDDTVVKWLGEKVFTPVMTVFVAFLTFLVMVNGTKIVISVGHLLAVENPEVASVIGVVVFFCMEFTK
ncbi:uncharacterized protein DFL_003713 [Arthrobotrys flagrans]|uniref:Uncharacterized protein n=1 Tax=Arthrobotrys flagrans TaxID=97331 RepID=A0A437A2M2_ARTFL|nr:hypothetical protein DFL_003713 [Arthrobotrys flagrans]